MKNSVKLLLIATAACWAMSCQDPQQRSSSSFNQVTTFDMSDYEVEKYFNDGLMMTPSISFDQVCFYNSACTDFNSGYLGGLVLSVRVASEDVSDDYAKFTSSAETGGIDGSNGYVVFNQTADVPNYDIQYELSSYYSANTVAIGGYFCNTLYNKRMKDQGLISPGDYLKITVEFYTNNTKVGSFEKYMIDYTGDELKFEDDWQEWDMTSTSNNNVSITGFDAVKFRVETSGKEIMPAFCVDNYIVRLEIVY